MKKLILSLLAFSAVGIGANAQSKFDKAAEDAASVICNCVNKTYKSIEDVADDEDGSKNQKFTECMESNTDRMKKKYEYLEAEPGFSDEMMFELMLEKLATKEKCELANALMQLGKSVEEEEEEDSEEKEDE
jgi:hypothetical protein